MKIPPLLMVQALLAYPNLSCLRRERTEASRPENIGGIDRGIIELPIESPLAIMKSEKYPACSVQHERNSEKISLARPCTATEHRRNNPL